LATQTRKEKWYKPKQEGKKILPHFLPKGSKHTLWWPKDVHTNIVFQNYATFNFTKLILKEKIINDTQNKIIQLTDIIIFKGNYIFY